MTQHKFSPFYLLYNCDPLLPIDNNLKPKTGTMEKNYTEYVYGSNTSPLLWFIGISRKLRTDGQSMQTK